jgi:hypothetical protein
MSPANSFLGPDIFSIASEKEILKTQFLPQTYQTGGCRKKLLNKRIHSTEKMQLDEVTQSVSPRIYTAEGKRSVEKCRKFRRQGQEDTGFCRVILLIVRQLTSR